MQNKLIIVANRLPFKIEKVDDRLRIRKSTGGLVSALDSCIKSQPEVIWVGAADFSESLWNEFLRENGTPELNILPLFLDKKLEKKYYNGFSNTIIWPLFHYFPSYAEYDEGYYKAYKQINEIFAEKVASVAQVNDLVWVHDYHLMLVPGLLKQKIKTVGVGFFLHIPFPSYEILKLIPESWRNNILTSLLSADVVGFHTKEYVSHFKRSLSFFLGIEWHNHVSRYNDNSALLKDYPISIDFDKFNMAFELAAVKQRRQKMKKSHPQQIIFSVDRLDYTKGVMNRLQAFEELLNERPQLREKVTFIINVVPSRDKHVKYAERRRLIEEQVGHINGLYGNVHWQPILYQYSHLSFDDLLGFYTSCDVALVTPLRDGMNLVAKEFVASRKDGQGTLVLSEFAGAAAELKEAILVNPNDIALMKTAMLSALTMPAAEQREAMQKMQNTVKENNVSKWTSDFLNDLQQNRNVEKKSQIRVMNFDERLELFEIYKKSKSRLILLDYDGTLVPYFDLPSDASPDKRTRDLLRLLAANTRNKVAIVSGRDAKTLDKWFGDLPIDLVAEHGAFHKEAGSNSWSTLDLDSALWKEEVKEIFNSCVQTIPDSFIEEKQHTITWHYRMSKLERETEMLQNIVRQLMIRNPHNKFDVLCGNKIIEAKSANVSKGIFVSNFLEKTSHDFVLAIGDDATDEHMFSKLTGKNHFTVKVGLSHTTAMYNLIGVSNVYSFLEQLTAFKNVLAGVA
jgi:trehalose 6-phosphate synthase/phosphatase